MTKKNKTEPYVTMTKVIRDCRDASLDYQMPLELARKALSDDKLVWDSTNGAYSHEKPGGPPLWTKK